MAEGYRQVQQRSRPASKPASQQASKPASHGEHDDGDVGNIFLLQLIAQNQISNWSLVVNLTMAR